MVASVPLVLTFVKVPAAIGYECQNRDTRAEEIVSRTIVVRCPFNSWLAQEKLLRAFCIMSLALKNYGVNVAAIVRFLAMHGAAVAEKAFVGIGVDAGVVDHEHAGIFEPPADETGEIEHRMPFARCWQEVEGILRVRLHKPVDEFAADFIGWLADQGTDRRHDVGPFGAKLLHRLYGGFDNSRQRA